MVDKKKKEERDYPEVIDDLRKQFGDSAIMLIGESPNMEVEAIPTGSLSLDLAIGIGGIPCGRITEVFGPEGSGKTTLCQHFVANAQAAEALAQAKDKAEGKLLLVVLDAYLKCADQLVADGKKAEALAIYKELQKESMPGPIRSAATTGRLSAMKK